MLFISRALELRSLVCPCCPAVLLCVDAPGLPRHRTARGIREKGCDAGRPTFDATPRGESNLFIVLCAVIRASLPSVPHRTARLLQAEPDFERPALAPQYGPPTADSRKLAGMLSLDIPVPLREVLVAEWDLLTRHCLVRVRVCSGRRSCGSEWARSTWRSSSGVYFYPAPVAAECPCCDCGVGWS